MTNGKNVGEAIAAITLGVLGGIAAAAIINFLLGSRCPVCNNQISQGTRQCPHCKTFLEWR